MHRNSYLNVFKNLTISFNLFVFIWNKHKFLLITNLTWNYTSFFRTLLNPLTTTTNHYNYKNNKYSYAAFDCEWMSLIRLQTTQTNINQCLHFNLLLKINLKKNFLFFLSLSFLFSLVSDSQITADAVATFVYYNYCWLNGCWFLFLLTHMYTCMCDSNTYSMFEYLLLPLYAALLFQMYVEMNANCSLCGCLCLLLALLLLYVYG